MPIFARTKFIIQDDCFDFAGPEMELKYEGPNPERAYQKIRELFWEVFRVKEGERVQERDYTWNKKGKRDEFNVGWHVVKDMDRFSYLYFKVKMKGFSEQKNGGKEGKLNVEIVGIVRTEYPQDTLWERSIFYEIGRVFWHKVFYQEKRFNYQDQCREMSTRFRNELKAFLNLIPKS